MTRRRILNTPIVLMLIGSTITLTACTNGGPTFAVVGNGKIVTETRDLGEFDEIEFRIAGDAQVVIGGPTPLLLKADDNILPLITTEVRARRLIISSTRNFKCKRPPELTITTAALKAVELHGSGDMSIDGVNNDNLTLSLAGSGDMTAAGQTKRLIATVAGSGEMRVTMKADTISANLAGSGDIRLAGAGDSLVASVAGSGDVYAFDLAVRSAKIALNGSGDIRVNALETLSANVAGSGDILYKGSPTVTKKIAGSGHVKPHK